nr:BLUF domain-containing protein [Sphingomonas aerophila]
MIRVRRVVYISKSRVGSDPTELDAIVARSSALNNVAGVTGMLWSNDACFAQVLEGEHDAVDETMKRILADPRHFDVELVSDRTVTRRLFGEWAMIRSVGGSETMAGTAFLVGFAMGERTASAHQLYQILVASEA